MQLRTCMQLRGNIGWPAEGDRSGVGGGRDIDTLDKKVGHKLQVPKIDRPTTKNRSEKLFCSRT